MDAELRQSLFQLIAVSISADHAQGSDLAAERGQVSADITRSAGSGAELNHLVGFQPGFERRLAQPAVDHPVFIQEKITQDKDAAG